MAQNNGYWPKQYFQATYPFWPDDYWQDAIVVAPPWCGWWPQQYWPTPNAYYPNRYWPACYTVVPSCGWWPQRYWSTENLYFPRYYWPACPEGVSVIVVEPVSIDSIAAFGTPLVYNTGDEPEERQERVKGFEHISWVQY